METRKQVDLAAVRAARERIAPYVRRTPLVASTWLSELSGADVRLKLESLQVTQAFKARGAFNAALTIRDRGRDDGGEAPRLVTASTGNHGRALATAARAAGLSCIVFAPEAADELAKGIGGGAGHAERLLTVQGDVANEQDAAKLINQTVERFGGLDILINNAGIGRFANIADMSTEDWNAIMGTNLTGVFFCTRAALPHLKQRGGGYIINISSLASKNAFIGGGAYCASKAALNSFTEALMLETRQDNIRVSDVLPGSVLTEFNNNALTTGADWKLSPDDVARVVVDLLEHPSRSLPSRVELRPSKPPKKG